MGGEIAAMPGPANEHERPGSRGSYLSGQPRFPKMSRKSRLAEASVDRQFAERRSRAPRQTADSADCGHTGDRGNCLLGEKFTEAKLKRT